MYSWDNESVEQQLARDKQFEQIKENQYLDLARSFNLPISEYGEEGYGTPLSEILRNMINKKIMEALYYNHQLYWDTEDFYETINDICCQLGIENDYNPNIESDGHQVRIRLI